MWDPLVHLAAIALSVYESALASPVVALESASAALDGNWPVLMGIAIVALCLTAVHCASRLDFGGLR